MLWSRSPEVLAFWWPSRRRTFYSRWFFSYQVLLQSTLFSALNTLHTGLVLTTCQQIRYWFLLSFSLFEPCKNIAKKKLKLFTPWKRWEPSLSWRIPLVSSVGSKIPSSSKMNKKSNECSIASKNLISIIICSQHAGSLSPWTWLIELACHKSTVSKR